MHSIEYSIFLQAAISLDSMTYIENQKKMNWSSRGSNPGPPACSIMQSGRSTTLKEVSIELM
jgi:hypothetical protein